jgi:ArsR family transcriptional regulator
MQGPEGAIATLPAACCTPLARTGLTDEEAVVTASVLKALGDPARVRIVNVLANAQGPACVCDITPVVGLAQSTVSFHLKKLVDAGLLEREQRGTWGYYSLNRAAFAGLAALFRVGGGKR